MHLEQAIAALRFDPGPPVWIIAAIGAAAALACGLALWRRARGAWFRVAAFAVLMTWLSGAALVRETREGAPDIGLLVIDRTDSMRTGGRAAMAEAARAAVIEQARRFPDLELRTITVEESGDGGTRLFAAIDRALAGIPRARLAGIAAITDGQIHDVPAAPPGGVPLNLLIPAAGEEVDRRLRITQAPGYGIVGKSVDLRFTVEDLGARSESEAVLTLRRDGEPAQTSRIVTGREQSIEVPIVRTGPSVIELSVNELPGEVSVLNNRAVVEINGVRDRLRVLLISGEPHPGERTWRRLLKSDPSVDLVHFTILRPPDKDDQTPLKELSLIAFPIRELFQEKIGQFDLVILDRFQNRGLLPMPYLDNIGARVRDGGALLMSVGPEFAGATSLALTPLSQVLPAAPARSGGLVTGPFRPEVTDLGQRHPVTAGLPGANPAAGTKGGARDPVWGHWYRRIQPAEAAGEILMRSEDGSPLLILNRVGQGRVAMLLSDQIWLWSRGHDGGGPQGELLRRVAHWLMREPALEEESLTAHVQDGRLIVRRNALEAPAPGTKNEFVVTSPEGDRTTLASRPSGPETPGVSIASMPASLPGVWRVTDGALTAFAAAGAANPPELGDLRATGTIAGKLARDSGGGVHFLGSAAAPDIPDLRRTEPDRLASGGSWIGMPRRHFSTVTGVDSLPLMPAWVSVPLILGLLACGWWRESA